MKMMSVDPGTSTCGVALWDIDDKFNITGMNSFTITIPTTIELDKRLAMLNITIKKIVAEELPMHLAHEAAFIHRFRPQAYGPIYAAIYLIRNAYSDIMGDAGMFAYPPKTVKAAVSTGDAGKDDMFAAANGIPEIKKHLTGKESEHAIDAILIGYTHLLNIRAVPEMLFT